MGTDKLNVFVSYSRQADKRRRWLKRVQVHLEPLARDGRLELWDDSKIKAGQPWREEIKAALDRADVAVLLISADYFASDFIANMELPRLLEAAKRERQLVILVHITSSRFDRDGVLSEYQSVNLPSEPIEGLSKRKQEEVFDKLARHVEELLQSRPFLQAKIAALHKQVEQLKQDSAAARFRYFNQFTGKQPSGPWPPSDKDLVIMFEYSRASRGRRHWKYTETSAGNVFSEWFHGKYEELKELEAEWVALLDEEVHLWKGKRRPIGLIDHPYLKNMYPFIAVSRVDRDKLRGVDDPRSYVVLQFLTWVRKLCKIDMNSEFILLDLVVGHKYVHLEGDFLFKHVQTRRRSNSAVSTRRFKLRRQLIVADCGQKIYTVSTGVPHPANTGSDYIIYVDRWLSDFQLGHR